MDLNSRDKIFQSFCEECIIDRRPGKKLTISRLLTEDQSSIIKDSKSIVFIYKKNIYK